MVRLSDAIAKISVNGKKVENLPTSGYGVEKLIKSVVPEFKEEPLLLKKQLYVDVYVSGDASPKSINDLSIKYRGALDSCGEWAPWSKIAQMQKK